MPRRGKRSSRDRYHRKIMSMKQLVSISVDHDHPSTMDATIEEDSRILSWDEDSPADAEKTLWRTITRHDELNGEDRETIEHDRRIHYERESCWIWEFLHICQPWPEKEQSLPTISVSAWRLKESNWKRQTTRGSPTKHSALVPCTITTRNRSSPPRHPLCCNRITPIRFLFIWRSCHYRLMKNSSKGSLRIPLVNQNWMISR